MKIKVDALDCIGETAGMRLLTGRPNGNYEYELTGTREELQAVLRIVWGMDAESIEWTLGLNK